MHKSQKAQGISINTIIIAAVGLIVLIVLIAVFTGKVGEFSIGVKIASGDITKNCADQNAAFTLRSVEDCRTLNGQVIASKDQSGNVICCTQ